MKSLRKTLGLALITLLIFGILYPLAMVGLGQLVSKDGAAGKPIYRNNILVGFENIGQSFTGSRYFWSRPSAVNYDASSTGGSNLGPTNPKFLQLVQSRIDTLKRYHPHLKESEIPVELVTASGSGLDPHISRQGALIQVDRIAANRNVSQHELIKLIDEHTKEAFLGTAGPSGIVNVLKLNLALDVLSSN